MSDRGQIDKSAIEIPRIFFPTQWGNFQNCVNSLHDHWGSKSLDLISLKSRLGQNNIFFKSFQQRNRKKTNERICIDCLGKCWLNHLFTKNLPCSYQKLPCYSIVGTE